jgi:hypothetical protein
MAYNRPHENICSEMRMVCVIRLSARLTVKTQFKNTTNPPVERAKLGSYKRVQQNITAMPTPQRQQFIIGQMAWSVGAVVVLTLLGALSLELFFVVSLIGFLVLVELTAPFTVTPVWRRRLRWVIAFGLLVFGYIVTRRIVEILPPEAF